MAEYAGDRNHEDRRRIPLVWIVTSAMFLALVISCERKTGGERVTVSQARSP